jgi:hypothetical protein
MWMIVDWVVRALFGCSLGVLMIDTSIHRSSCAWHVAGLFIFIAVVFRIWYGHMAIVTVKVHSIQ